MSFVSTVRRARHGTRRARRGIAAIAAVAAIAAALSHVAVSQAQDVAPLAGPEITIGNPDGAPYTDRLAFSRIGSVNAPPPNAVHDEGAVRIKNEGTSTLTISALNVSGPWTLLSPPSLPIALSPNNEVFLRLRFVAGGGDVHLGSLAITSNDADESQRIVQLGGFWQSIPEGNQEPSLEELMRVFGYTTTIAYPGQRLNNNGLVQAVGNEVVAAYWQRATTSRPATIRQLAMFQMQNENATVSWFNRGSNTATAIATSASSDAQTVLPRRSGADSLVVANFTPGPTFGFKVDNEWSDPAKNDQNVDRANGCPGPCGHHVRFWVARDRSGNPIPNTYLMGMDYAGINYDYNDNLYLISNIKPVSPRGSSRISLPMIRR